MIVSQLIRILEEQDPNAHVVLWHWDTLLGGGRERYLTPTLGMFREHNPDQFVLMPNGVVPGTGPEKEHYLRVEHCNGEIVGDYWMTPWEVEIANKWVTYYGDRFIWAALYTEEYDRPLPEEYREDAGGE